MLKSYLFLLVLIPVLSLSAEEWMKTEKEPEAMEKILQNEFEGGVNEFCTKLAHLIEFKIKKFNNDFNLIEDVITSIKNKETADQVFNLTEIDTIINVIMNYTDLEKKYCTN